MPLIQRDDVVRALSTQRPDEPLGDRVRLRCAYRSQYGLDTDRLRPRDEATAVRAVAIADQEARAISSRRRLD